MAQGLGEQQLVKHTFNYDDTKIAFNQELDYVILEKKLQTKVVKQRKHINNIIRDIQLNKTTYKKYFTEKCQVVNENGIDILCQVDIKVTDNKPEIAKIQQILSIDDLFDVLFELHMQKPHLNECGIIDNFTNCVTFNSFINTFLKSCETCSIIMKTLDTYFRIVGEISSFPMLSPDGKFTEIFVYIERNTNFVLLRPLKTVSNKELAYELLSIFSDFGAPSYLDSNVFRYNKKHYNFLNILNKLNPPFKVPSMYATSRNHKITVTLMRVRDMLYEWMERTGSSNWAIGAHVVQWQMNINKVKDTYIRSKLVNGPIQSPYHAMFGTIPHKDIVEIKDKHQTEDVKSTEKVLIDCSQCNLPMYKVLKCNFCQRLCHFTCCIRYIEPAVTPILINKCNLCTKFDTSADELILGT